MKNTNWVDDEVAFYDFIWKRGTELCNHHVNSELMKDFAAGGDLFQEMVDALKKKFPTRKDAIREFKKQTYER